LILSYYCTHELLLLFHEGTSMEIQYTALIAKGEERYVIKAAEVGAVIRLNKTESKPYHC